MKRYQIENTMTGLILGVYEASSPGEALDLLAREAGYDSYEEAQDAAPSRPGAIQVVELDDDEDESSIEVYLTKEGVEKVLAWLVEVAKPDLRWAVVLFDIEEHLWETYPEAPAYELGVQFTISGRPELLHLVEGEDYKVEVVE